MLVAPAGAGMASGAFILNKIKKGKRDILKYVRGGVIFASLTLLVVSLLPYLVPTVKKTMVEVMHFGVLSKINLLLSTSFFIFLFGLSASFIVVPSQTILQNETDPNMRGRVFGLTGMMVSVTSMLPLVFFGVLADIFSSASVLAVIALLGFLWAIFSQKSKSVEAKA
jgi:MFS family permease